MYIKNEMKWRRKRKKKLQLQAPSGVREANKPTFLESCLFSASGN